MKVAQEIDVDGVTIIINPQNKLEAKLPDNSTLDFEEVELTNFTAFGGETTAQQITEQNIFGIDNKPMGLIKLVRLKDTNYFMFKLEDVSEMVKPPSDSPSEDTPPKDTSNAKEYYPESEAPKVVINTTDYTYEISGSLKLKTDNGVYLTGMNSDTTGTVSRVMFTKHPHNNAFISVNGEYSGSVGEKRYDLISTTEGIKFQDELGNQMKAVAFNMEAPDNYDNTTQHNVTVEVQDNEIVVFGSGKTTSLGYNPDSYPAFFESLFGIISSDFNYVEA